MDSAHNALGGGGRNLYHIGASGVAFILRKPGRNDAVHLLALSGIQDSGSKDSVHYLFFGLLCSGRIRNYVGELEHFILMPKKNILRLEYKQ